MTARAAITFFVALLTAFVAFAGPDQTKPVKSGLVVAGFDRSVTPQDDLYRYVNGGWLSRTGIPDKSPNLAGEIDKTAPRRSDRQQRGHDGVGGDRR